MRDAFFCETLVDYLKANGRNVPDSLLNGEAPVTHKGPHGKPYFSDSELSGVFFSLSHTKGHNLLCFSNAEIGADCENIKARPGIETRLKAIARRCFTEDEQAYVAPAEGGAVLRFFEIWTAKEAYMKYTGKGFSQGFRSFSALNLPDVEIETGPAPGAPDIVYSVCMKR